MKTFQILSHPLLLNHGRSDHPECRQRLDALLEGIQSSPFSPFLDCSFSRLASREELKWNHTASYIDRVLSLRGVEAYLDPETPLSIGSVEAACLAAGLSIELTERVLNGHLKRGFLLGRPPGHHSRPGQSMGFCVFNNIALAAHSALRQGVQRILILDWDVHHGNGTQESFYQDDRVLFIDLHQENLFPSQSGLLTERGDGKGFGYTVNIPLPHSCRDSDYLFVFDQIVVPLARRYQPELILVSAGFDAHETDPLGSMYVTSQGFGRLTQRVRLLADSICNGRLISFLEGGYEPKALAQNGIECFSALAAEKSSPIETQAEPYLEDVRSLVQGIRKVVF